MTLPSPVRILVVDDNEALRENLAETLQLEGYDVVEAADGPTALARLRQDGSFRAVLLDLSMPGMDGREVLGALRGDPLLEAVRVVVTTGHAGAKASAGLAADGFLLKPFGVHELLAALREAGIEPAPSRSVG